MPQPGSTSHAPAGKERPGRTGKSKAGAGASDAVALISRTVGLPDRSGREWESARGKGERRARARVAIRRGGGKVWRRTLGIYGVNSAQPPALIGHRMRGCMTEGRGQVCFRSLPIASSSYWSRPISRAASSRQKQSLFSPSDRLEAGVLDCLKLIIGVRSRSKAVLPLWALFGHDGGRDSFGGTPMSRV
jgi:hypothetical protein